MLVTKILAIHKYIDTNAANQIRPNPADKEKKPCYFDVYLKYQSFSSCQLGHIINSKKHKNAGKTKLTFYSYLQYLKHSILKSAPKFFSKKSYIQKTVN